MHFETNCSLYCRNRNRRKTLATRISEAYNTNAWAAATSKERQQGSLRTCVEYTENDSADDVYLEDISTYYGKFMLLHNNCLLH